MLSRCGACRELRHLDARASLDAVLRSTSACCPAPRNKQVSPPESNNGWTEILHGSGLDFRDLPGRLVFVNGAPGSGKGTMLNTVRDFTGINTALTMSSVIARHRQSPDSVTAMTGLVSDTEACWALTTCLGSTPLGTKDLILDGFPRSKAQVDYLEQLLHYIELKRAAATGAPTQPALDVCMVMLHVSEETSIQRQLQRQWQAERHNAAVRAQGRGRLMPERKTDQSPEMCRERYAVHERSLSVMDRIRGLMPVYNVDAEGSVDDCRHSVAGALIRHQQRRREAAAAAPRELLGVLGGYAMRASGAAGRWGWTGWPPQGLVWS